MNYAKLEDMKNGWFIGKFTPTSYSTDACEVAVKKFKVGDSELLHYHKVSTEITLVLSGVVRMVNQEWHEGDVITLEPGDQTDFLALTDAVIVSVKIPGELNDKYLVD
jgi:quercetin dioxygenase-like cupin family protein